MNYDHLTRPRSPARPLWWRATVLTGVLATVSMAQAWHSGRLQSFYQQAQSVSLPIAAPVAAVIPADSAAEQRATEITKALDNTWANTLLAVERASAQDVTVLELRPDFSKGTFEVSGEAKTFEAVMAYLKRLRDTGLVTQVELTHEQAFTRDHVDTVGFTVKGEVRA